MMKEYGGKVAPLAVLACFLNYVGNHILYFLQEELKQKQCFYPKHKVVNVTLMGSGDFLTTAQVGEFYVQFKSKHIVMANGAK